MRKTLECSAIAAAALTLALCGFAAVSTVGGRVAGLLHGARTQATVLAAAAAEAGEGAADADRRRILALINAHRRGASAEWCARLAEAIYRESTEADLDPLMVASIVARESSFKPRAVSHAGAVGLMQLRPWVAEDVARRGSVEWNGLETLRHPELNVRLGILYYKELVERFDGDAQLALTAYNQGPTRVSRNVMRGTFSGSNYADAILDLYASIRRPPPDSKT